MYEILKIVHHWWAWIVLILLLVSVLNSVIAVFSGKKYTKFDFRLGLFSLITSHIQLLLGLILYFVSPLFQNWSVLGGQVMKDAYLRKMLVEHPFVGILGIVFITIGWSLHKKQKDDKKAFSKIAIFYGLGLIFILSRIPWETMF